MSEIQELKDKIEELENLINSLTIDVSSYERFYDTPPYVEIRLLMDGRVISETRF